MLNDHREEGDVREPTPPSLHVGSLQSPQLIASRLRYDGARFGLMPIPEREDAYFVGVKLRAMVHVRMWYGERLATSAPMPIHSLCFTHFDNQPHAELYDPFDCMIFKIPNVALGKLLDDTGARRIEELRCPTPGTIDPVVGSLAACLLPALDQPASACTLFVDMITRALNWHILLTYGGATFRQMPTSRGGLARWQEDRVRDVMYANLAGDLTVAALARECAMSVGHFSLAFKQSFGQSPYQYLIEQRLTRAKELMRGTTMSLLEIATASGFSAQSHFNRRFLKATGLSPGVWRRLNSDAPM